MTDRAGRAELREAAAQAIMRAERRTILRESDREHAVAALSVAEPLLDDADRLAAVEADRDRLQGERDQATAGIEEIIGALDDAWADNASFESYGDIGGMADTVTKLCRRYAEEEKRADQAEAERDEARAQLAERDALLVQMVDPDECWYDHHGGCQAHGYLDGACPMPRAREILAASRPSSPDTTEATG